MASPNAATASTGPTTRVAVLLGVAAGVGVLGLYLVAGFVVANWSVREFLRHLTPAVVGWLVLAGGMVVAVVAVPVAAYLRLRVVSPLVVLVSVLVGWTGLGFVQEIPPTAFFGLSYYALALSPVYLLLYLVCGGIEYRART